MTPSSKAASALAELCRLALPPPLLVPAILHALHDVVPSQRNLFDWTDADGRLLHYYIEGPVDTALARHYFEEFHNRREAEAMPPFAALAARAAGIASARDLDHAQFFGSALYHEIWKPQGLRYRVEAVLRGRGGRLLGSLVLYRGPRERCFSSDDEARLARLLPTIADAIERAGESRLEIGEGSGVGIAVDAAAPVPRWVPAPEPSETIVLGAHGLVLCATAGATRLAMLARGRISAAGLAQPLDGLVRPWLAPLRLALARRPSQPAEVWCDAPSGRFRVQAQALLPPSAALAGDGGAGRPGDARADLLLTLQRHEPEALALERRLRALQLTPAQHRVCRELARGTPQAHIARTLDVSPTTVVDQLRKIYRRLGIDGAGELRLMLNADAPLNAGP